MRGRVVTHYRVLEKLGEGGMGEVYKAEDLRLKRIVALKFLSLHLPKVAGARDRFYREAQAASKLDHPNICTVYEIDEFEGRAFIAMAYVEGRDLSEMIAECPLDARQAIDIAIQVAEGLDEAHDKGIVHRDIKSNNIMVTEKGLVKIVDFGLAKLVGMEGLTGSHSFMGTLEYASPEQSLGKSVDQRTDIWSLGVVIYEMLMGRLPFRGENSHAIMHSILHDEPKNISTEWEDIPSALARIVQKALQKDPESRYRSMDVLIRDLKSVDLGSESDALPSDQLCSTKLIVPARRMLSRAALVGVAAAALLLALVWVTRPERPPPPPTAPETPASAAVRSIAVLPFANHSPDLIEEYFCDGLSEELINTLCGMNRLRVVARTSSFSFKGTNADVREIGGHLNVDTILEGSVRSEGDTLRVTAQLVDVGNGYHLWSERYDCKMKDIFSVQEQIALAIADKLQITLRDMERTKVAKHGTRDIEAYKLYLKGRWFWNKFNAEGFLKAVEYFGQAVEKDPEYAAAYAGIADCYSLLPGFSKPFPSSLVYPQAKAAALKAIELDNMLAESHSALGWVKMQHEFDFRGAEQEFKRAIELNPGYAPVHSQYALLLMYMGRSDEAIGQNEMALELDPFAVVINTNMAYVYYYAGLYDKAIDMAEEAIAMDSTFMYAHHCLGMCYVAKSMYKEADAHFDRERMLLEEVQKLWGLPPEPSVVGESMIGLSYFMMGETDEATRTAQAVLKISEREYVPPFFIGSAHFCLGEMDRGFAFLDKAYEERDYFMLNLKILLGKLESVRNDPRFARMVAKMGL
ncbi:MAG: serine/threonine-protein kinase [Candidatus Abyssubacteria bacterium]